MAHDGYQLRQVLDLSEGAVIFRDTFDQYGPGSGYLNTAGFLALGRRLLAVKYFVCGVYAVTAVALFAFARLWLDPVLAGFSLMVWLGLAPFYQHGIMISPHAYVLFFQTLATIVAARDRSFDRRRFAAVGVLTGLSWCMKQSIGALFLAAILAYLAWRLISGARDQWRPAATAAIALVLGFAGVVGVVLAVLWTQGALPDWYLQTVAFPRDFYLLEHSRRLSDEPRGGWLSRAVPPVAAEFVRMQLAQPLYWIVIRAVVLVTAIAQLRRHPDDRLVLVAAITAFLWLGAFPSANFMHQWWAASLTIPPFVWCVRRLAARISSREATRVTCTVVLVLVVAGAGILDRKRAATFRAGALRETIEVPPVLRGIRTDAPMKRALAAVYGAMARYHAHHPGTKVVAIDSADGFFSGINESLVFLSAFEGNSHTQPVYWNLPVLSTTTYPRYTELLQREIRDQHPLLIDHRTGQYQPLQIDDYALLAAVQSDFGYWYVYGPEHADRLQHAEASVFVARDGAADSGFAENGRAPAVDSGLNPAAEGASRGAVSGHGAVNVYTWPADLPLRGFDSSVEQVGDPVFRAGMIRTDAGGGWTVDGYAGRRFDDLVRFPPQAMRRGAVLIVRGEIDEGGFQVGFIQGGQWSGFVTVTDRGPFEAVLEIQRDGQYGLTLANCLEPAGWQTARRHWIRGTLGMLVGGFMPNRFRISQLGWTRGA